MKRLILLLGIIVVVLAVANPNEAAFREHIREKQGIAGSLGIAVTDLLAGGKGGIRRDNYLVASRFYIGGDGILPRQDLAWGVGGMFFENSN
ncbi:hypothetical protein [Luteolibacter marinus]|uniref:hypothetical protein n=1 Tax=Luteolibacter marinus TaxID=2776705 RepID=UPI001865AD68|nr:hypothetical protein [Luteolibacter marinus]